VTKLFLEYGLVLLFFLVAVEGAGIPLPGEAALITGAVLASQGHFSIVVVIAVAAAGAVTGDNTGYWIGRKGGRALLRRTPIIRDSFERLLPPSERFFEKHGAKTIFIARFVTVLRITAAWVAGISRMPWRRFFLFDAAGATAWATVVGVVAYEAGRAAADAIARYGLYAGAGIVALVALGFVAFRLWRRRSAARL
jgi:membrane protein DedA with SNARE-associated domain